MSAGAKTFPKEEGRAGTQPLALPSSLVHQKHLLFNRELSWLEFNRRVLEEAQDPTQPLLERLKFLAIFSTNLDEFFMVRVSGLMEELEEEVTQESPDGMTPAEQLKAISERLRPLVEEQTRSLTEDVLPQLAAHGVVVKSYRDLSRAEKAAADACFEERIFPVLTPQAVDPAHPFPYISNLSLNIGVMVEPRGGDEKDVAATVKSGRRFARVKIPPVVPHLVSIDETGRKFVFVGSLIAANIASLFPEMRTGKCHLFRVTRDADFEIREDEAGDLLRTMQQHIRRRRFGTAVRLELSETMPADMAEYLTTSLDLTPQDVYTIAGPLNIPDLMQLYGLELPELKDRPLKPSVPPQLAKPAAVFDAVRRQDVLLHHPYTSYNTVVDFIRLAAADPDVLAIKICLYRTGRHSPVVQALIDATERGKQVAALVELKARFDEESNIEWAQRLEQAGVHVVYGILTEDALQARARRPARGRGPSTLREPGDGQLQPDDIAHLHGHRHHHRRRKYRRRRDKPLQLPDGLLALLEIQQPPGRAREPARAHDGARRARDRARRRRQTRAHRREDQQPHRPRHHTSALRGVAGRSLD